MAVYAIGDLQGCYQPFCRLLERLAFDPAGDRLWLVGDLVNRGDGSLACLRYVRELGDTAVTVLGNHDLNLLALAERPDGHERANATLKPILEAPDRHELLDWLRGLPLFHRDTGLGWSMVHAGLAPAWTPERAAALAREVESVLAGPDHAAFFAAMYGNSPVRWDDALTGWDRLRAIVNYMTRVRFCHTDGALELKYKKTLEGAPAGLVPWFAAPGRRSAGERIVFGHWSALSSVAWPEHNVWCIDTGCVWGKPLTALRLDSAEPELIAIECRD